MGEGAGGYRLYSPVVVLHGGGQQPCHVLLSFEAHWFPIKITATVFNGVIQYSRLLSDSYVQKKKRRLVWEGILSPSNLVNQTHHCTTNIKYKESMCAALSHVLLVFL